MLQKSDSAVDIFILNNFSSKKEAVPKSNCPKELSVFNNWLLGCSEKVASEKITATKK